MSNFTFNIKGLLRDMRLAESKALWPLFEAVVNAIQAIEDSPNRENGKISVYVHRENTRLAAGEMAKVSSEKIEAFSIEDNGVGLDTQNYESFLSAYSTHKVQKGCKGIGRFLWLKAFDHVEISSIFCENGQYYQRQFVFSPEGNNPEDNVQPCDETKTGTRVKLVDFQGKYKMHSPVELDVIATKLIEHCLLFFICGNCPQITLMDGVNESINLNHYFETNIRDSLHQDSFTIKDHPFTLYHVQIPEGALQHELHFCANMHEVKSEDLKSYIPDLRKKITPNDASKPFYYAGYLTGDYLDSVVNTTRTAFDWDEKDAGISLFGTGENSLAATAIEFVKGYLSDYLVQIEKRKRDQIDRFVAYNKPTYRYLLHTRPKVYEMIPADLSNDALELELHKQVQEWETQVNVISVGMLSEGWDAKTVTHILGLRAFSSQLLCEQVVGRGLRRTSYDLAEGSDMFTPEYVNIFGIPFTFLPHESDEQGTGPVTPPKTQVEALKDRTEYEIRWPNIIRLDRVFKPYLKVDLSKIDTLELNAADTRLRADLAPIIDGKTDLTKCTEIDLEKLDAELRLQRIIFEASGQVYDLMKASWQHEATKFALLGQVIRLVEGYLKSGAIVINPPLFNTDPVRKRIIYMMNMNRIVQHLWGFIKLEQTERVAPVFDPNKRIRSTADMPTWFTSKPCCITQRSHISHCVYDSSWEATESYVIEKNKHVDAWVKNDHLGFEILYVFDGVVRKYTPDFLIRLDNGKILILETKGQETRKDKEKREALAEWVEAVNALGEFGQWCNAVSYNVADVDGIIARHNGLPINIKRNVLIHPDHPFVICHDKRI